MGDKRLKRQLVTNHSLLATKHSAFTLIELLVVISVIAVLMAVLLPVLGRVRKQAKAVVCQANLRQWGMALRVYAMENNGCLPTAETTEGHKLLLRGRMQDPDDPNQGGRQIHHFDTQGVTICPSAKKPGGRGTFNTRINLDDGSGSVPMSGQIGATFNAWTITKPAPVSYGSYGYNAFASRGFSLSRALRALKKHDKMPVLVDSLMPWVYPRDSIGPPDREDDGAWLGNSCINRHSAHVNGLFLDWSVRKVGLKELWTLKWYKDWDTANKWTPAGGVRPEDWPLWMRGFKDY